MGLKNEIQTLWALEVYFVKQNVKNDDDTE